MDHEVAESPEARCLGELRAISPRGRMQVDPVDVVALTRSLVDIDSTTGREGEAGRWLADYLRGRGFAVTEQRVDATRFNVIATVGDPLVAFSTHFDCVPP